MRKTLFAIAIAGLLVSSYLAVTYTTGAPILCNTDQGCDVVRSSSYSSFFNISTPYYGVVFYLVLATLALLATKENAAWVKLPLAITTAIGVAVSAYLTYLEAFVIEAWCVWCVVSALLTVAAFALVWYTIPRYGNDS